MQIPSSLFRSFRRFAGALFEKPIHRLALDMQVHASPEGCVVSASYGDRKLSCHVPISKDDSPIDQSVTLPHELVDQLCLATASVELGEVESTENGSRFTVRWQHGVVNRQAELDLVTPTDSVASNTGLSAVPNRFLVVLAQAGEIADNSSMRYALDCIELDGQFGTVAATDGRHMVRFDGFVFPWQPERILFRRNRLFKLKELTGMGDVRLGVQNDTLTIAVGPWHFEVPIERTVKFPTTAQVIPNRQRSSYRVRLNPHDLAPLANCLSQLPGSDEDKQPGSDEDKQPGSDEDKLPVIIDLNGHVAIIGKYNTADQATGCPELDRSLHIGPDYRVGICRQELVQAVKLGIDSLFFYGPGVPVLACGPQVQFVWMPLTNLGLNCDLTTAQRICTSQVEPSSGRKKAI